MQDIIFIALILIGFVALKYFIDWCERQTSKK
ncbi:MAG: hypothetical protein K0R06_2535 [Clostridium sp.]|jgi:hypothetical protein|nr:hypothetical protein [Clostridium sp.]